VKLNDLYEDYCSACGGWDREQQGRGHNLGCPVGEPGTTIARTGPEIEEGHAIVAGQFDGNDIEEIYSHLKGYGGAIVKVGVPGWSKVTPFTTRGVTVTAMFGDLANAESFQDAVKGIMSFSMRPKTLIDSLRGVMSPAADAEAHEMMHDYITGRADAKFVKDYYLS
jgi:hypothetical protein